MTTMDFTQGYIIYRDQAVGEPVDLTTPLQFFPSQGSDELFFALKTAYPLIATNSERMRSAVIDFLIAERENELNLNQSPFIDTSYATPDSACLSSQGSWETTAPSSMNSSPQLFDNMSPPASVNSPASTHPVFQNAKAAAPLAIDQMTGVFSLTSTVEPKTKGKRKMTKDERAAYRKRRQVGACDKCKAQKRKCVHNCEAADAAGAPSTTTSKVVKRKSEKAVGKAPVHQRTTAEHDSSLPLFGEIDGDITESQFMDFFDDNLYYGDNNMIETDAYASGNMPKFLPSNHSSATAMAGVSKGLFGLDEELLSFDFGSLTPSHGLVHTFVPQLPHPVTDTQLPIGIGTQETPSHKTSHQSVFEGCSPTDGSIPSLSTPRLKRRIPKALHSIVDASNAGMVEGSVSANYQAQESFFSDHVISSRGDVHVSSSSSSTLPVTYHASESVLEGHSSSSQHSDGHIRLRIDVIATSSTPISVQSAVPSSEVSNSSGVVERNGIVLSHGLVPSHLGVLNSGGSQPHDRVLPHGVVETTAEMTNAGGSQPHDRVLSHGVASTYAGVTNVGDLQLHDGVLPHGRVTSCAGVPRVVDSQPHDRVQTHGVARPLGTTQTVVTAESHEVVPVRAGVQSHGVVNASEAVQSRRTVSQQGPVTTHEATNTVVIETSGVEEEHKPVSYPVPTSKTNRTPLSSLGLSRGETGLGVHNLGAIDILSILQCIVMTAAQVQAAFSTAVCHVAATQRCNVSAKDDSEAIGQGLRSLRWSKCS